MINETFHNVAHHTSEHAIGSVDWHIDQITAIKGHLRGLRYPTYLNVSVVSYNNRSMVVLVTYSVDDRDAIRMTMSLI